MSKTCVRLQVKVIIAGSRSITDYNLVETVIKESQFQVGEVVSGKARGVDTLGEQWANGNGIRVEPFPARWDDLNAPNARIKYNKWGPYNANAGHDRNEKMAKYADALILVWDGKSNGSGSMLRLARQYKLNIFSFNTTTGEFKVG